MVNEFTHQLPEYSTPLFGRTTELGHLDHYLSDPTVKLITISGLGGIGKTRLAVEVARRAVTLFEDGVVFVPLESALSAEQLYLSIANAADMRLASEDPADRRVKDWIANINVLLILDNVEQLVDEAINFSELLQISPGSKIVATTRVVLGLEGEWNLPLNGLVSDVPGQVSDSVEMFANVAKRFEPSLHFDPGSGEYRLAQDVCESLGGVPLAIEMAAAWTRTLSLQELQAELTRNNELLVSARRDAPSRHRSIQSVFDSSWMLLDMELRRKLNALAFLKGPFDREAAQNIAGASLMDLRALVQASLLVAENHGHFRCHPLLRDCAVAKLIEEQEAETVEVSIAKHYSDLASNLWPGRSSRSEVELTRLADLQIENFRLALDIVIDRVHRKSLRDLMMFFALYMEFKSRYLEGLQILERISKDLEADNDAEARKLRATALSAIGWWHLRLGNTDEAMQFAERSLELLEFEPVGNQTYFGDDPELLKGFLAVVGGRPDLGRNIAENRLEVSKASGNLASQILSQYLLSTIQLSAGDLEDASRRANELIDLVRMSGSQWFEAYCLNLKGDLASANGNHLEAAQLFRQSFEIRQQFDDHVGMGEALIKLGEVSLIAGNLNTAEESFIDARSAMETAGDRGNMAIALNGLGFAMASRQRFDDAFDLHSEAFSTGKKLGFTLLVLRSLVGLARVHSACGDRELSADVLEAVAQHPSCDQFTRSIAGKMEPIAGESKFETRLITDLPRFEARLLVRSALRLAPTPGTPGQSGLSEREIEILGLMADGKTNPEIAAELILSPGTVKWYSSQIYLKLQVRNRAQAISTAQALSVI